MVLRVDGCTLSYAAKSNFFHVQATWHTSSAVLTSSRNMFDIDTFNMSQTMRLQDKKPRRVLSCSTDTPSALQPCVCPSEAAGIHNCTSVNTDVSIDFKSFPGLELTKEILEPVELPNRWHFGDVGFSCLRSNSPGSGILSRTSREEAEST